VERAVGIVGELALGRRHAVTQPNHAGRSADAGGSAAAGALLVVASRAKPNLKLAQGGRCRGPTRLTPAWRSTPAGRWRARRG